MPGAMPVPFTPPPQSEETRITNFNCPLSLRTYLEEAGKVPAGGKPRGMTDVIVSAIRLDKELGEKTADLGPRLKSYAEAEGLSLHDDAAEVVAQLLRRGLELWEAEQEKPAKSKKSTR